MDQPGLPVSFIDCTSAFGENLSKGDSKHVCAPLSSLLYGVHTRHYIIPLTPRYIQPAQKSKQFPPWCHQLILQLVKICKAVAFQTWISPFISNHQYNCSGVENLMGDHQFVKQVMRSHVVLCLARKESKISLSEIPRGCRFYP